MSEQTTLDYWFLKELHDIHPGSIDNTQFQPRHHVDDEQLQHLKESIAATKGNVEPVLLLRRDDKYITLAGHRRVEACLQLNLMVTARIVRDIDDRQAWMLAISTNVKEDMAPSDYVLAVQRLIGYGMSVRDVAAELGLAKSTVDRYARCPTVGQCLQYFDSGEVGITKLVLLAELPEEFVEDFVVKHGYRQVKNLQNLVELLKQVDTELIRAFLKEEVTEDDLWREVAPVAKIGNMEHKYLECPQCGETKTSRAFQICKPHNYVYCDNERKDHEIRHESDERKAVQAELRCLPKWLKDKLPTIQTVRQLHTEVFNILSRGGYDMEDAPADATPTQLWQHAKIAGKAQQVEARLELTTGSCSYCGDIYTGRWMQVRCPDCKTVTCQKRACIQRYNQHQQQHDSSNPGPRSQVCTIFDCSNPVKSRIGDDGYCLSHYLDSWVCANCKMRKDRTKISVVLKELEDNPNVGLCGKCKCDVRPECARENNHPGACFDINGTPFLHECDDKMPCGRQDLPLLACRLHECSHSLCELKKGHKGKHMTYREILQQCTQKDSGYCFEVILDDTSAELINTLHRELYSRCRESLKEFKSEDNMKLIEAFIQDNLKMGKSKLLLASDYNRTVHHVHVSDVAPLVPSTSLDLGSYHFNTADRFHRSKQYLATQWIKLYALILPDVENQKIQVMPRFVVEAGP